MSDDKKALVLAKKTGLDAVVNYYFQTKTPKEFIKSRPGAGGQVFKYVPIGYVLSQLNIAFGMLWEWRVMEQGIGKDQIWIRGELTIKDPKTSFSITRSGVGGAIIKKSRTTSEPISVANDLKAADSDALKVAAAKFGIGADVKFKEMEILESFSEEVDLEDNTESIKRIVTNKMFAIASQKGFKGEAAERKVKEAFSVAHMSELSTPQLELAIKSFETYEDVAAGEEPRKRGEIKKEVVNDLGTINRDTTKCALISCVNTVVKHGFCSEQHHREYWGKAYKNPEVDPWTLN